MKKQNILLFGMIAFSAALLLYTETQAMDKVTLQLKWVPQAQFAGYYVAKDKGFYEEEGIDIEIRPGGPDLAPAQIIAGGQADVVVDWMPSALAAREKGVPLVNIAQPFAASGMMLTCLKSSGIHRVEDLKAKKIGVWFFGNEYPFLSWMERLGLDIQGGPDGVTVIKQGFGVDPLLQGQADCISTMSYNEYWVILDAGLSPDELTVFKYEDQGISTLEDGLYVLEKNLKVPAFRDKMVRFVRASMRGWEYAKNNQDEAVEIVLENDFSGAQTRKHQKRMLSEVIKLLSVTGGVLLESDYQRTVNVLLRNNSRGGLTKTPQGAWTHGITDKALGQ